MGRSVHRLRAFEVRKVDHPVFPDISKYWMTVAAKDLPAGISSAANARDPVGLNKRVYRDVRDSLAGTNSVVGTFDLMNKGITILAIDVRMIDKRGNLWELEIDDEVGGIVDGAHTAKIIEEANALGSIPVEQYVEIYIRTNVVGGLVTDIARGLNTSLQVAPKSIYNIDKVFDWLKEEIADEPYVDMIAWKESDATEYDVRDLVGVLDLLNVIDYPNDGGKHPISAYEKWSIVLDRFADDFEKNKDDPAQSKYHRLRPLLRDGLALWDHIRREFRQIHNDSGGAAGKMNIVEEASAKRGDFTFPFARLAPATYRLTKGASFPILASFRNYVEIDEESGNAYWRGGFVEVLKAWRSSAPDLVSETARATKEIGRNPDQLGKNRPHWDSLHKNVRLRVLQEQLETMRRRSR